MHGLVWLLIVLLTACGITEPNVEDCGDNCPGVQGGQAGGGTGGSGGDAPDGSAGDDAQAGSGGDSGTGGVGGSGGSSGDAGGEGGTPGGQGGDGGACGACPSESPHCAQGSCVECVGDEHCDDGVCIDGSCEACRSDLDCKEPAASRCTSAHACAPCTQHAQCEHLEDTQLCVEGSCVQCTSEDRTACGTSAGGTSYVCDVQARSCSTTATRRSAGLCEACVSDEQCGTGQLCVLQRFDEAGDTPDDGEQDVGWFCLYREDSTEPNAPAGDCANLAPYVDTLSASVSISGTEATVCALRVTTCPAYRHFSAQTCAGVEDDASCGDARFSDGLCEMLSASTFRCTTPCGSNDDCKSGFECTSTEPSYCSLQ